MQIEEISPLILSKSILIHIIWFWCDNWIEYFFWVHHIGIERLAILIDIIVDLEVLDSQLYVFILVILDAKHLNLLETCQKKFSPDFSLVRCNKRNVNDANV